MDEVVEDFQRLGYLNDEAYTSSIIRSLKARGASALKIKAKLREKGILHVPTEDKMLQLASDTEELKSAVKLLKRRRRGPFISLVNGHLARLKRHQNRHPVFQTTLPLPVRRT